MKSTLKRALIGSGAAIVISVAGLTSTALAHGPDASRNRMDSLVSAIATKFNLNKTDVQKVIDDQMKADHQAQLQTKLKDLVSQGKLTQSQSDLITAKANELMANRPDLSGKTQAEIKAYFDAQKTTLAQWVKDNNIPTQYLRFLAPGPGGHGGHKGFGMMKTK